MNQSLLTISFPALPISGVWLLLLLVIGLLMGVLLVTGQLLRHFRQLLLLPAPDAVPEPAIVSETALEAPSADSMAAGPEPVYPSLNKMAKTTVLLETTTQV